MTTILRQVATALPLLVAAMLGVADTPSEFTPNHSCPVDGSPCKSPPADCTTSTQCQGCEHTMGRFQRDCVPHPNMQCRAVTDEGDGRYNCGRGVAGTCQNGQCRHMLYDDNVIGCGIRNCEAKRQP